MLVSGFKNQQNKTPFLICSRLDATGAEYVFEHPQEFALKEPEISIQSGTEATSAASDGVGNMERRKGDRFALSASAEMVEPRTKTQLTGRASDLGMGGCYVDTLTPYPVGTSVMLILKSENHRFARRPV